ncbi:conserved hypothetical protein [Prosthecochloris aestuarii DSM 271]|uniref:DUF3352 domain-containing protein n=1 Tax=Prosthecochloris aestuarii (strain DSM 271 / SK 413) TaxID=290512 RepID=B4S5K1_PROA2|nr:hypothetical protein [Prosthecochloris aestuarii]ACF45598.1 conserved hypothetical protein [Prosthecochloris aestuarii DSM 271]
MADHMQSPPTKAPDSSTTRPPRKKPSLLVITVILGTIGLVTQMLWVNWPKQKAQPEPLSAELREVIDRLPGISDALIYIGLKDIRQTPFWSTMVPDSIKQVNWLQFDTTLTRVMNESGFQPSRDIDTLLVEFQSKNSRRHKYMSVIWGTFPAGLDENHLIEQSGKKEIIAGQTCIGLSDELWICRPSERMALVASSADIMERFLQPHSSFLERDSTTTALIDKAIYKSHLWFTLSSPNWTIGALQSLTSGNKDINTLGNLNRIRQLALSLRFDDGISGQTEWVYKDRQTAYFASTFLWSAIKLSSTAGTRTSEPVKALLKRLHVMQNLNSVVIKTELPLDIFTPGNQDTAEKPVAQ